MVRNVALMFSIAALSGIVLSPAYAKSNNSNDNKPSYSNQSEYRGENKGNGSLASLNKGDNGNAYGRDNNNGKGHGYGYQDNPGRGHGHNHASES